MAARHWLYDSSPKPYINFDRAVLIGPHDARALCTIALDDFGCGEMKAVAIAKRDYCEFRMRRLDEAIR